jgi:hypothetical protein
LARCKSEPRIKSWNNIEQAEENYTAKDIEVLSELEGVRKRPGMYIGSTNLTVCIIWFGKSSITPSMKP